MYKFFPVKNLFLLLMKEISKLHAVFWAVLVFRAYWGIVGDVILVRLHPFSCRPSGMWRLCILEMFCLVEGSTRSIVQHRFPEDRSPVRVMSWSRYSDYPTNGTVRGFESRWGGLDRFISSARLPGWFCWVDTLVTGGQVTGASCLPLTTTISEIMNEWSWTSIPASVPSWHGEVQLYLYG